MNLRYCPTHGAKLVTRTSRGGLPRRVCPECGNEDADANARTRRGRPTR